MGPEISMKSLRISRYGGDIFSLLQEAMRRSVKWGEKKKKREMAKCLLILIGNKTRIEWKMEVNTRRTKKYRGGT